MNNYRKIYKQYYGSIPIDLEGRTFDIHHIDGNHKNNNPTNLIALSIYHHYIVHYVQGDYGACQQIAIRMKMSPQLISELATKANFEKVSKGIHHFVGGKIQRKMNKERVENGTHHWLGDKNPVHKTITNDKNPLCGDGSFQRENNLKSIAAGTFISQQMGTCPHCGKTGPMNVMPRWHYDNCKMKPEEECDYGISEIFCCGNQYSFEVN